MENNEELKVTESVEELRGLTRIQQEKNTILSKANSLDVSNKAIDLKTEIEKVREQIQNIE